MKSRQYRVIALHTDGAEIWRRDVLATSADIAEELAAKPSDPPETRYATRFIGMQSGVTRIHEVGRDVWRHV